MWDIQDSDFPLIDSDIEIVNSMLETALNGEFQFGLWNSTSLGYLLRGLDYLDNSDSLNEPRYFPIYEMIKEYKIWSDKNRPVYLDSQCKTAIADFVVKIG